MTDGADWKNLFKQQVRENIQLEQAVEYLQGLLQSIVFINDGTVVLSQAELEDFQGGVLSVNQRDDEIVITLTPQGS